MSWKDAEIEGKRHPYAVSFPLTITRKDLDPKYKDITSLVTWCNIEIWADSPEEAAGKFQEALARLTKT